MIEFSRMQFQHAEFIKAIAQVADPLPPTISKESLRFHVLPVSGFAKGLIPMLLLLFQRFLGLFAFAFLPWNQAVCIACLLVLFNLFLSRVPEGEAGVVVCRPCTQRQKRIIDMVNHYCLYEQPPWCLDNHWTTVLPLLMFQHPPKRLYRQSLDAHDGATLSLDWYIPSSENLQGIILVIPGLNGSSQEGYVADLMDRVGKSGFASAVLNGRGAGKTKLLAVESAFHLGRSTDLLTALVGIETATRSYASSKLPIFIVGYSAGGIRAMKFATVYGASLQDRVAGIVSFGASVRNHSTLGLRSSTLVYQPVITHTYASMMYEKILTVPEQRRDVETLFTSRGFDSFRDFDRRVTSVLHNMTLEEYEREVFAYHDDRWRDVAVPMLVVNAIDDPVLHIEDAVVPEMAYGNSNIVFLKTKKGGHIGWPVGLSSTEHGYRWMSDVTLSFINAIHGD